MLSIKMKSLIATSFIVLALGSEAYAYDQVAEASSPGKWNEDIGFRITARCNGVCRPNIDNITVGFMVPDGWEIKAGTRPAGGAYVNATCDFIDKGVLGSGSVLRLSSMANTVTQQFDAGTFTCGKSIAIRRVKNNASLSLEGRRISDSGYIDFVRIFSQQNVGMDNGGALSVVTRNLTATWTRLTDLSRQVGLSVPSRIAIRYNSKIDLLPGETKDMFEVSEAYGCYTVNVNVTGDASSDLTLVHSSGATGNNVCNGSLQKGNVCKIKANSQISWYGQKQAVANITLSII